MRWQWRCLTVSDVDKSLCRMMDVARFRNQPKALALEFQLAMRMIRQDDFVEEYGRLWWIKINLQNGSQTGLKPSIRRCWTRFSTAPVCHLALSGFTA